MIEFRFHGRGGQGAVTSAELLAQSAVADGKYAQAFPSFGPERRGAPVQAFARIHHGPIHTRSKVYEPDVVLVLDYSLTAIMDVAAGLKPDGLLVVSTSKTPEEVRKDTGYQGRIAVADGIGIAMEVIGRPINNITMLGALMKASSIVPMDILGELVVGRFGEKIGSKNIAAMKKAFEDTKILEAANG